MSQKFDVLVVGGGHAGCEAAILAARLGAQVCLITLDTHRIGYLSCNPAVGGVAKGHLVKDVDILGGQIARNTDASGIQYRLLNESKGPAVRATRVQCDKPKYAVNIQKSLDEYPKIFKLSAEVASLELTNGVISGVRLTDGSLISSRTVVITSGTFLAAIMHRGSVQESGGRVGDAASFPLSAQLKSLGFRLRRLKTGTPPRLHKRSIPWAKLGVQLSDPRVPSMSFFSDDRKKRILPQVSCGITKTNERTHEIIRGKLSESPMFTGAISGVGPRYCPSIEDKVFRFADKLEHHIFLEPEGLDVPEVYVNGISTSLPAEAQDQFIHSIEGLESAEILRFGYAVEYDALDARQLTHELQSKDIPGLFFAGQVNGTSGYEEAAAQGLMAGINAALYARDAAPFILRRSDSYIGVMIDDLVSKGSDEPYRMFTSRAEFRLLLREDNPILRLFSFGKQLGLYNAHELDRLERFQSAYDSFETPLSVHRPEMLDQAKDLLSLRGCSGGESRISIRELLRRPEISISDFFSNDWIANYSTNEEVLRLHEVEIKYSGYIQREKELIERMREYEEMRFPQGMDFRPCKGLSNEALRVLSETRPETLAQASRLQGVNPSAITALYLYMRGLGVRS